MGLGIEARLGQLVTAAGGPERYALPSGGRASPCPAHMHAMRCAALRCGACVLPEPLAVS